MNSHSMSKTYTWSSEMGDYIGMESCVDLQQIENVDGGCTDGGECSRRRRVAAATATTTSEKKDYPPPIPWLARVEESPTAATQMPWVLKRYRTGDGRLIIKEEKVAHHEYFRARRSGGRLTLQLVHLDEYDSAVAGDDEEEREDLVNVEPNLDGDQCQGGKVDGGDEISKDWNIVEEGVVAMRLLPEPVESGTVVLGGGGGGGGKCYDYSGVRSNPCLFGMPLPAMKPVHI